MIKKCLLIFFFGFVIYGCEMKPEEKNINQKRSQKHVFILGETPSIVGCGNIFFAYGFLFKEAGNESNVIVGILLCPDGYGDGFFREDEKYNLKYTKEHIADSIKGFILNNPYENNYLPTYFISEINIDK